LAQVAPRSTHNVQQLWGNRQVHGAISTNVAIVAHTETCKHNKVVRAAVTHEEKKNLFDDYRYFFSNRKKYASLYLNFLQLKINKDKSIQKWFIAIAK
jgi:hypothetical protein